MVAKKRGDANASQGTAALHTTSAAVADIAAISRCRSAGRRAAEIGGDSGLRMAPMQNAGYSPAAQVRP